MNSSNKNLDLSLASKLRQKTIIEAIQGMDWKQSSPCPIVVELDPTTQCNLVCPDCINRELLNQGFFSRERLKKLIVEMVEAGVKAVVLIGGGEPLLHPEISWVIDYLGSHQVKIGLTTNGMILDKYLTLIAQNASWVRVSVDAATSETFNKIRPSRTGESQFHKVIDNMTRLAKIKKGRLGYSFMLYHKGVFGKTDKEIAATEISLAETNIDEIYEAALLAKNTGCDYFEIKPMYNINHFTIQQKSSLTEKVFQEIEKATSLENEHFKILFATKLKHTLSGGENVEPKDYHRCAMAQLRTLVTPSGVYVCPYFRGRADQCLGEVIKTSFREMWNGHQRANVLKKLDPAVDCLMPCIRHESNLFLEEIISGQKIETMEDFDLFI